MYKHLRTLWITVVISALLLSGCTAQAPLSQTRDDLLDTIITITIHGNSKKEALDAAFHRIQEVHNAMTAFSASEISSLNNQSGQGALTLSEEVISLLAFSQEISKKSDGAFDITIRPVTALWNIRGENPSVPSQDTLAQALALVDYAKLQINSDKNTALLEKAGMGVDLGGVAKGYACDEATRVLRENGTKSALLDLGGNIYGLGTKPDGSPWRIGIRSPLLGETQPVCALPITDQSVVTSGVYERYFIQDEKLYHHIIDPYTGYPVDNGLLSTTVISPISAQADALSTACFVLGIENSMALLAQFPGTEAIFITEQNEIIATPGLANRLTLTDSRFTISQDGPTHLSQP